MQPALTPATQLWRAAPNFLTEYQPASDLWSMLASRISKIQQPEKAIWRAEFLVLKITLQKAEEAWSRVEPQIRAYRSQGVESALGRTRDQMPEEFEILQQAVDQLKATLCYVQKWRKLEGSF